MLPTANGRMVDLGRVGEVTEVDIVADREPVPGRGRSRAAVPGRGRRPGRPAPERQCRYGGRGRRPGARGRETGVSHRHAGNPPDRNEPSSLIRGLTPEECQELIARGVIDKGMIPKVEACLTASRPVCKKTHIIDGRLRHSLLLEMYTDTGIGTEIV